jgi:hypothetical protein
MQTEFKGFRACARKGGGPRSVLTKEGNIDTERKKDAKKKEKERDKRKHEATPTCKRKLKLTFIKGIQRLNRFLSSKEIKHGGILHKSRVLSQ